jgi:hypothetical protein
MNEQKIPAIWKWIVLVIVLCNIGLMATIWLKPHWGNDAHPETPRDYVIRNLKFTDDQVKLYDALIKEHRETMNRLGKEAREYRKQFFGNLKNGQHSSLTTDSLAQLIANNQKQIEMVTYRHFEQVRTICNDEQKAKFDEIINDVMKKMNSGMRGGPPPRPGNGQGPPPDRDGENHPPDDRRGPH